MLVSSKVRSDEVRNHLHRLTLDSSSAGWRTSPAASSGAVRRIHGILVKDAACQTSEPFNQSDFNFVEWWISSIPSEDPDEAVKRICSQLPYEGGPLRERCQGPDADDLLDHGQQRQIFDADTKPLGIWTIPPPNIKKPKALRPTVFADPNVAPYAKYQNVSDYAHSLRSVPGTPLSARSTISTSSEDGCSSVSSYSTLPSSISSPDSTRVANIGMTDKLSAFSSASSVGHRSMSFRMSSRA